MGKQKDPGAELRAQSQAMSRKAAEALEKVDLPDIEKMRLALEMPELVLSTPEEKLQETALAAIQIDPRLKQAQMSALEDLSQRAVVGLSDEDKAQYNELRRRAAADEQARQQSIISNLMERGAGGAGSELAARLLSSQSAADRASAEGDRLSAQASQARMAAAQAMGNTAGQIRTQDYGEQSNVAQARDAISAFNAGIASKDTAARRENVQQRTNLANQQQQYNKELQQRAFENQMAKQGGIAGAYTGQANLLSQQAAGMKGQASGLARGLSGAATGAAAGAHFGGVGAGIGAGVGALGGLFSEDGGIKYEDGGVDYNAQGEYDKLMEKQKTEDLVKGLNIASTLIPANEDTSSSMPFTPVDAPQINLQRTQLPKISPIQPMNYADGGSPYKMGYEDDSNEGRLVPGESFSGDLLPDRINSREAVLNVDSQERLNQMLQELKRLRNNRTDVKLDKGEAILNESQPPQILEVLQGKKPLEALPDEPVVESVEEKGFKKLIRMLGR